MTSGAERLEALLANISDIVTVMGANGEWISSSGAGNRLLGWEPDLDPEGGIFELLHPDDVDAAAHAFAEVIAGTRTSRQPIDLRVLDAHGTYHILETFAENLLHDDRIYGIVLTSRDVTAARAAEAEQLEVGAQLAALVSSLSDAVLFLDGDRKVVLVNDADAAGLAEVKFGAAKDNEGLVLVTTLGTGIGSALIYRGVLVPNTELGHLEIDGHDAETQAAASVKTALGLSYDQYVPRLQRYYESVEALFWPDLFVVGGGVSKASDKFLPKLKLKTPIVPAALRNRAGIIGAAWLAAN